MAQGVHADIPFIHLPIKQRRATAPTMRVTVIIFVAPIQKALLLQGLLNQIRHIMPKFAAELVKTRHKIAFVIQRGDGWGVVLFAQFIVFGATTRCIMHNTGALGLANIIPQNNAMGIG